MFKSIEFMHYFLLSIYLSILAPFKLKQKDIQHNNNEKPYFLFQI